MDVVKPFLSPSRVGLALLAALLSVIMSYHLRINIEKKLLVGLIRCILQLLLLGYVLLNFIFSVNSPVVVAIYLFAMLLIAAVEVTNRQVKTYDGHYIDALIACTLGGGGVGLYAAVVIFHPTPWWNPHVTIPTAGMIIGSAVTGPSVVVERLLAEVTDKRHETEIRLSLGATGYEALLPVVRAAIYAAMMPNLNMMAIIGLVSIPGMMTGQLLGGAPPLVAAEYQMAIIFLINTATTLSSYTAVLLAVRNAVMSQEHRLTPERIKKKTGEKQTIDVAIFFSLVELLKFLRQVLSQLCCCLLVCYKYRRRNVNNSNSVVEYSKLPFSLLEQEEERISCYSDYSQVGSQKMSIELTDTTLNSRSDDSSGNAENYCNSEADEGSNNTNSKSSNSSSSSRSLATYTLLSNVPSIPSSLQIDKNAPAGMMTTKYNNTTVASVLLQVSGLNVMSGHNMLFSPGGLNLTLYQGKRVTIEGSSGIGKTRLLRALAQLDAPLTGNMQLFLIDNNTSNNITNTSISTGHSGDTTTASMVSNTVWRSRVIYIPQVKRRLSNDDAGNE